jgi:hypothetical protein
VTIVPALGLLGLRFLARGDGTVAGGLVLFVALAWLVMLGR